MSLFARLSPAYRVPRLAAITLPVTAAGAVQRPRYLGVSLRASAAGDSSLEASQEELHQADSNLTAEQKQERDKQKRLLEKAKWSAVGSLNTRPHARKELEQKLLQKGHSPQHVQETFEYLEEQSLLNDRRYATTFVSSKWSKSLWAPPRIRQELLARGLTPQDINAGLLATFGHSEQDLAQPALEFAMQDLPVLPLARWQEARGRAADPALCTAVQLVDSCRTKLRGPGSEEQRMKRLENWLRARMHSYSVIRMVKTFLVQDAAEGV